jgi:U3 small nucleolar RNA-associated protein 18
MAKKSKQKKKLSSGGAADATTSSKKRKQSHASPLTQHALKAEEGQDENKFNRKHKQNEKRKSKQALEEEAEERRLTALLFGDGTGTMDAESDVLQEQEEKEVHQPKISSKEKESSSLLFEIDRTGVTSLSEKKPEQPSPSSDDDDEGDNEEIPKENDNIEKGRSDDEEDEDDEDDDPNKPAWVDEDDDEVEVDLLGTNRLRKLRKSRAEDTSSQPLSWRELENRLRSRYKSTMQFTAQTEWARLDVDDDDQRSASSDEAANEDDEATAELQSSSQPLLAQGNASSARLPPNILNVMRCPDANQSDCNKAVVQAVHFHPGSDPDRPLLLTGGLDKTLRFFQVGEEKSEKIHGIHCKYCLLERLATSLSILYMISSYANPQFHTLQIIHSSKATHFQCPFFG